MVEENVKGEPVVEKKTIETTEVMDKVVQETPKKAVETKDTPKATASAPEKTTPPIAKDKTVTKKKGSKEEEAPVVPEKKKGKKDVWVKKEKPQGQPEQKSLIDTLKEKWKPVFWGRFGKKNLRTRRNPKFDKWRKPRGIDIRHRRDDGMVVQMGYRMPQTIRGIHPSGYKEVLVSNSKDLETVQPHQAARFSARIGRKKRIVLQKIANEKKIKVLN